jgi:hypothetical protein
MNKKLSTNKIYIYDPVGVDIFDPPVNIKKGDKVKVVNLPGCPPSGTMNHAHVEHAKNGKFAGLVHINSLTL